MRWILFLHLLGATIWVGGHLILAFGILPGTMKSRNFEFLSAFEEKFERVGIPALILQIATGLYMAYVVVPDVAQWFTAPNPAAELVRYKLIFLALTAGLAVDARFRVIPKLTVERLNSLALHIIGVTVIAVAFAWVGIAFRFRSLF